MDEKKKRKPRVGLTILCVFLALVLLTAASPFLYDALFGFSDYDDPAALAAAASEPIRVRADGGSWGLTASVDKAGVYALAEELGAEESLRAFLVELPARVEIEKLGYTLDGAQAAAQARVKLFGFLPLQLRAEAEIDLSPERIVAVPTALRLGRLIPLPLEKLAALTGAPELTKGFSYELPEELGALEIDSIRAENGGIVFHSALAAVQAEKLLAAGPSDTAKILALFADAETPAEILAACNGDDAALTAGITDLASLTDALTRLAAASKPSAAAEAAKALETDALPGVGLGETAALQEAYSAAAEQALLRYAQALHGLRDSYKELEYKLTKAALVSADGQTAESVLPEDWGARTVLQYNRDFEAIVRANDGVFSAGLQKWLILPNPSIYALKRDSRAALPSVPGVEVFDLTLALRLPDGTPAVIFDMAEGPLAVNTIPETLYQELLGMERLPVLCASDVPRPERSEWLRFRSEAEDLSDVYFIFCE